MLHEPLIHLHRVCGVPPANAQSKNKYFLFFFQVLDGEMYDKLREFFILMARTELECCGLTQECFTKIMSDSALVSIIKIPQFTFRIFLNS